MSHTHRKLSSPVKLIVYCTVLLVLVGCSGNAAPSTTAPNNSGDGSPYGIASRPQPAGENLEALLPETVGRFKRTPIEGTDFRTADVYGTYTAGEDTVFMGFSIAGNETDAQAVLNVTREEAQYGNIELDKALFVTGQPTSYFKTDNFISWTRGTYVYYADASSPQALDEFMSAFPY